MLLTLPQLRAVPWDGGAVSAQVCCGPAGHEPRDNNSTGNYKTYGRKLQVPRLPEQYWLPAAKRQVKPEGPRYIPPVPDMQQLESAGASFNSQGARCMLLLLQALSCLCSLSLCSALRQYVGI